MFSSILKNGWLVQSNNIKLTLVHQIYPRCISIQSNLLNKKVSDPMSFSEKPKKKKEAPFVTLIGNDGQNTVINLLDASKMAKAQNMNLVKHKDAHLESKGKRDVYKLVGTKELFQSSPKKLTKKSSYIKGEKRIEISTQITDHHLDVKLKSVLKWLMSSKQVQINVMGKETGRDRIVDKITQTVTENKCKVIQNLDKGHYLQLIINPPKPDSNKPVDSNTNNPDNDAEEIR